MRRLLPVSSLLAKEPRCLMVGFPAEFDLKGKPSGAVLSFDTSDFFSFVTQFFSLLVALAAGWSGPGSIICTALSPATSFHCCFWPACSFQSVCPGWVFATPATGMTMLKELGVLNGSKELVTTPCQHPEVGDNPAPLAFPASGD